ncbi:MAG: glycoside hydrolase family 127 protein, partial [Bacteroidales bacterium]|nr:glycoside hydrolase family 127 protein [Bacteroidales bacterium]
HWSDWGKWRGADNLEVVYWLYGITGDPGLLELGKLIHSQTADWTSMFLNGDIFRTPYSVHCVNMAQGFKAPVVWWQYSGDESDLSAPGKAVDAIRHTVGLPTGLWAGDELLHAGVPTRGSELCTAVEMMYSLEEMLRITGDLQWADYLERVAYNALPTQVSDGFDAKQYYQQTNQVSCTLGMNNFSTPHDGTDVVYGTLNGYPCCLCNMHQGWPKFTQNLWYATPDGGLAALVYAPSRVKAKVAGGVEITMEESTDYPFREDVSFAIGFTRCRDRKATFPLRLRVPGWCSAPELYINGKPAEATVEDGIICIEREWRRKDIVTLHLPMNLQVEEWYDKAWTVVRGPLVYALKMEEEWAWKPFNRGYHGEGAWEVTSPSPWNYCLMRDSFSPDACEVLYMDPVSPYPWNVKDAPVHITVPARVLPGWTNIDSIAFWTEDGVDFGEEKTIELVPYGCTTLRIAEFPTRIVPWDMNFRY